MALYKVTHFYKDMVQRLKSLTYSQCQCPRELSKLQMTLFRDSQCIPAWLQEVLTSQNLLKLSVSQTSFTMKIFIQYDTS